MRPRVSIPNNDLYTKAHKIIMTAIKNTKNFFFGLISYHRVINSLAAFSILSKNKFNRSLNCSIPNGTGLYF